MPSSGPPSDAAALLALVAEHLRAGRDAQALAACEAGLAVVPHPALLQLSGVALARLGRIDEAIAVARRVAALAPSSATSMGLGNALARGGRIEEALEAFRDAIAHDASNTAAAFNAGKALLALGRSDEALPLLLRRARAQPGDFAAQQAVVDAAAAQVRRKPAAPRPPAPPMSLGRVAIGMCSVERERERSAVASLERALQGSECSFTVVHDAKSLATAYNGILETVDADVVILCHDDIEVIAGAMGHALAAALGQADIVGVAGARQVRGPAVLWAGHPHVHGWVTYPREGALDAAPLSFDHGVLSGMQALDGVFLALGPRAQRLRFDPDTFDGFHFYDLDFTYRAHLAGLRLAVSTDVRLVHRSEGDFGDAWQRQAAAFRRKYPTLTDPAGPAHWYGARLPDRDHVNAFYDLLATLGPGDRA